MPVGRVAASKKPNSGRRVMLDHQCMLVAAARGREQDGLSGQRQRIDQIEHVLEEAGIAALIDRLPTTRASAETMLSMIVRPDASSGPRPAA
jgi:hypothetical protein